MRGLYKNMFVFVALEVACNAIEQHVLDVKGESGPLDDSAKSIPTCKAYKFTEKTLQYFAKYPGLAEEHKEEVNNKTLRSVDMDKSQNQVQFLIIGAQKAGTDYLADLLNVHPKLTLPGHEVHFFDHHYPKWSFEKYRQRTCGNSTHTVCGEKSPIYMTNRRYIDRIHRDFPEMKLILVLREPVSRILSAYNYAEDRETDPDIVGKPLKDALYFEDFKNVEKMYCQRSLYMRQISYILTKFPRDQLYFILSDDLHDKENFDQESLLKFLGVPFREQMIIEDAHRTSGHREMEPELEKCLQEIFSIPNKQLFDFLGRDMPESWKY